MSDQMLRLTVGLMKVYYRPLALAALCLLVTTCFSCTHAALITDPIAEKMLQFQRNNGGWPQYKGDPTDYTKDLDTAFLLQLHSDKSRLDATIDDNSTTYEIKYLLSKVKLTGNRKYLASAESGIQYLLQSQNAAGGWPQKYPDTSEYHHHITYNDEAMISVMWIMKGLAENTPPYDLADNKLKAAAEKSLARGIDCILKTQYRQHDTLTVWCAQHDALTLAPASARAFEPSSLSGKESVGIILFLESLQQPSPAITRAIEAGIAWFKKVGLPDKGLQTIEDQNAPRGRDLLVIEKPGNTLWARFYDLDTNQPIFMGRNGLARSKLSEIEIERRTGYAYLGSWPKAILKGK